MLGFPILYCKGMRPMMFQLSGFCYKGVLRFAVYRFSLLMRLEGCIGLQGLIRFYNIRISPWCLVGNGGMDPYSSPYIIPNDSPHNPFPHFSPFSCLKLGAPCGFGLFGFLLVLLVSF